MCLPGRLFLDAACSPEGHDLPFPEGHDLPLSVGHDLHAESIAALQSSESSVRGSMQKAEPEHTRRPELSESMLGPHSCGQVVEQPEWLKGPRLIF